MTHAVIVSLGRTGSTLLTHMLSSHPDAEFHGELFAPMGWFEQQTRWSRREYVAHGAYGTDANLKGFKMPFDWLVNYPGVLDDLKAVGYKVVLLRRSNSMSHYVSMQLASKNADWSSRAPYANQKLQIDKWALVQFVMLVKALDFDVIPKLVAPMETHELSYESLQMQDVQDKLLDFLGIDRYPLSTPTVKARTRRLDEVVDNYDELKAFFTGSPLEPLFIDASAP